MSNKFVIGLDYGTDSVRALVVDATNGKEICTDVFYYPRWEEGKYCIPEKSQFRHHPLDYIEGLEKTIKSCLKQLPKENWSDIKGISIDTTGSTPCMTNKEGKPLALLPEFSENPNAMFILWKDHTAVQEADEINRVAKMWNGEDYTKYEGGVYSAEWFWSKILHIFRIDKQVMEACYSVLELCDWIPALLIGANDISKVKRSRCAAGHKAMWHESWGGLPSEEFLIQVDPILKGLRSRLYTETYTSDIKAGIISSEWANKLGLKEDVVIGVGAFDAHMGAVGAEIAPYSLVKILGTSTCDVMVVSPKEIKGKLIKGICGQVDGSVIPGMIGLEAGQSSFGDVYAWFKNLILWPAKIMIESSQLLDNDTKAKLENEFSERIIPLLEKEAKKVPIDESGILAIDWLNGRRTPNANQLLKGAITGLDLGTSAPKIYRALVEATAYGARKINDCFESQGISIKEIIGIGGVSKKSDFVMQVLSDVMNQPIKVCNSEQACALGAAMFASVVAGIYNNIEEAQQHMGSGYAKEYKPNPINVKVYNTIFERYCSFGSYIEQDCMQCKCNKQ
jgi:L-ribulokinase